MIRFITKKLIVSLLIVVCVVPATFVAIPTPPADAAASGCLAAFAAAVGISTASDTATAPIAVPVFPAGQVYSQAETAGDSGKNWIVDCIEKPLALALGKALLAQVTQETVKWINSGFQGNPTFVTDPGTFFQNIGDQVAGQFILGSDLAFLCSPFQLQIKIALALNYSNMNGNGFSTRSRCTLSQVAGNINNFFNDPFGQGSQGWSGWFAMTQNPTNNPMGAFLSASAEMDARIANAQGQQKDQLAWGNGFLSMQSCTDSKTGGKYTLYPGNTPHNPTDKCQITTPGSVIGAQLNSTLGIENDQLGLADDLDKIFTALAGQVFKQIFTGAQGLLGSTQTQSNGTSRLQAFVDSTNASSTQAKTDANTNVKTGVKGIIKNNNSIPNAPEQNLAINKLATESCLVQGFPADALVDGDKNNVNGDPTTYAFNGAMARQESACTPGDPTLAWMQVDLGQPTSVNEIRIYQRPDPNPSTSSINNPISFVVEVQDAAGNTTWTSPTIKQDFKTYPIILKVSTTTLSSGLNIPPGTSGQIIKLQAQQPGRLEMAELEVYPNTAPVINVNGDNPLIISVGTSLSQVPSSSLPTPQASATDTEDGDITSSITETDNIDTNTEGTYTMTYSVTDSGGLKATATRSVVVQKNITY